MKQSAWWALGLLAMAGGVACGPSQAELASQAKAAAEVREKADEEAKAEAHPNMVLIPAGKVTLGKTHKTSDVAAFLMDRTEVTTAAYAACVASGKCTPAMTAADLEGGIIGNRCNAGVAGRENHPINCVDWNQADAYCKAQGLRLPTEEEWEYAATGGDGRTYPWGNEEPKDQLCWDRLGDGKPNSTCAVGAYPKGRSPFGIDDMAGNVSEWTSSQWTSSQSGEDNERVERNGGWEIPFPTNMRSDFRLGVAPMVLGHDSGFRCAGSAP